MEGFGLSLGHIFLLFSQTPPVHTRLQYTNSFKNIQNSSKFHEQISLLKFFIISVFSKFN